MSSIAKQIRIFNQWNATNAINKSYKFYLPKGRFIDRQRAVFCAFTYSNRQDDREVLNR
jgi:hypothetical protein